MVSFIIPAFNEEKEIGAVIDAIRKFMPIHYNYEIIVVDNGSTDSTSKIVRGKNAVLLQKTKSNVSTARNAGANYASGNIFIFMDADIYLTEEWKEEISNVIISIIKNPLILTGSTCSISDTGNWIEECWFKAIKSGKKTIYINSGHLIISRKLFEKINGFNDALETGEDVDLSIRASQNGATIIDNSQLRVIHTGYPKTIRAFFKRERWHGRGDYPSFSHVIHSKPALLSLFQSSILVIALIFLVIDFSWIPICAYIVVLLALSLLASVYRFQQISLCLPKRMLLYIIYFQARTLSFIDVFPDTLSKSFVRLFNN